MRHLRRNERGFTLIELMLVIGAIAVLLGVLIAGAGVLNTSKMARAEQDIQTLISAGQAYQALQPAPTYAGISFAQLQTLALLPANASADNPWGNPYTVSGDAAALTITTDVGDATRCATLSARLAGRASSAACATGTLTVTF